jgi:hypothetical protein
MFPRSVWRRVLSFASVIVLGVGGCGSVAGYADDLARQSGSKVDDIMQALARESAAKASSVDDAGRAWQQAWPSRLQLARSRYESVDPKMRGAACDFAGSVVSDVLTDKNGVDAAKARLEGFKAVLGTNTTLGARLLADDVKNALAEVDGNPSILGLLVIKTAICQFA